MIGASFVCNICGSPSLFHPAGDWRESPSCTGCGSSVRMRGIIHSLTTGLFGQSVALPSLAPSSKKGVGLSDWEGYAIPLARLFDYVNSFYHQEPMLDVAHPTEKWLGSADFLISSDVFEHVPVPAHSPFEGAASILRPGGLLVLTVPYGENAETQEHYPRMKDFRVLELGGEWVMVNRADDGELSIHRDLVFHGGPGTTLEMRLYSRTAIVEHLKQAGFTDVKVHEEAVPQWGVFPPHPFGLPISARRS